MERNKITNLTTKLIENLELEIPIDFDKIFTNFSDLEIRYDVKDLDVYKRTTYDQSNMLYVLELKGNGQSKRDRFTIAHELGHLFLGHVKHYEVLYRREANELKYAANQFAADLLMPKDEFIKKSIRPQMKIMSVTSHWSASISKYQTQQF